MKVNAAERTEDCHTGNRPWKKWYAPGNEYGGGRPVVGHAGHAGVVNAALIDRECDNFLRSRGLLRSGHINFRNHAKAEVAAQNKKKRK